MRFGRKLREKLERAGGIIRKIEAEDWVKAVRESRDGR
jgi:hypothetical protein